MTVREPVDARVAPHDWGDGSEMWGPRHDYRESLLLRLVRRQLPSGNVLDAGCGAGSLTLKLLDAGYDVTAADASAPFVAALSRVVHDRRSRDRAAVVRAGVEELPFRSGWFDAVVCAEVLEHLDDDRAALTEVVRTLRPGGLLVVSVPANPWRYDWVDHWAGHRRRYAAVELARLLTEAGLDDVSVVAWGFPLTGLYDRVLYKRILRRRLEARAGARAVESPSPSPPRWLRRVARAAFEVDTLFLGRWPGYLGLLASGRGAARVTR